MTDHNADAVDIEKQQEEKEQRVPGGSTNSLGGVFLVPDKRNKISNAGSAGALSMHPKNSADVKPLADLGTESLRRRSAVGAQQRQQSDGVNAVMDWGSSIEASKNPGTNRRHFMTVPSHPVVGNVVPVLSDYHGGGGYTPAAAPFAATPTMISNDRHQQHATILPYFGINNNNNNSGPGNSIPQAYMVPMQIGAGAWGNPIPDATFQQASFGNCCYMIIGWLICCPVYICLMILVLIFVGALTWEEVFENPAG
jgi:hypothetical protein